MTIEVSKKDNTAIIKTSNKLDEKDLLQILKILDTLLCKNVKFSFLIDASETNITSISYGITIVRWMRSKKEIIKKNLICSAIIIKYKNIAHILNKVFSLQKPSCPNIITYNIEEGYKFIDTNSQNIETNIDNDSDTDTDNGTDIDSDNISDEFNEDV